MLTDTHCHIIKEEYNNYKEIIKDLEKNNIKRIIINGYDLESNKEVLKLIEKYDNVYGAIGVHPNYIDESLEEIIELIESNINHKKIIAIGEIGLDYYRNPDQKEKQIETFNRMLTLAQQNNKPVIIHNRQSTDDILKILKNKNVNGIIHSFSGSYETASEFIKLGFKLGINGIVTFKNSNLGEVLKKISIDNILLETDSPYITPEPLRGKKNEPKNLIYIAKKISEVYGLSLEIIKIKLEENFHTTFDIE